MSYSAEIFVSTTDPMGGGWAYWVRDDETGRVDSGLVDSIDKAQQSVVNILVGWGAGRERGLVHRRNGARKIV